MYPSSTTPQNLGGDHDSSEEYRPWNLYARYAIFEATTLPSAHATRAQLFCISDDLAIVPGSGADGGFRVYDPDNTTYYARVFQNTSGETSGLSVAGYLHLKSNDITRLRLGGDIAFFGGNAAGTLTIGDGADASVYRSAAGVIAVGTGGNSGSATLAASAGLLGSTTAGSATTAHRIIVKKTSIADNTATDVLTITVPNANHAAAIKVTLLSSNGSTDAFESSRCAEGMVILSRTTGVNVVAAAAALDLAQIATVAAGATHTLAYGVSSITGAVGAANTFTIQVTIDDSGNTGSNQVVVLAELINSEATGVTMAAA